MHERRGSRRQRRCIVEEDERSKLQKRDELELVAMADRNDGIRAASKKTG
jgi:hypothetical protein